MTAPPAPKLQGPAALLLASGVVALEFATAVSTFVAGSLLPLIENDLSAERQIPLLVAGTTVGMFTALPFATRIIGRFSPRQVLMVGLLLSVTGTGIAASAQTAWIFASGRFVAGFAGALLAVYGISAAIKHLEDSLRLKVVAAMSAMWILPATIGPSATLALEHVVGWRLALLSPLPLMVLARLMVVRSVPPQPSGDTAERPVGRTLMVPLGVTAFVLLTSSSWWYLSPLALVPAIIGFFALMPEGTSRLRPGAPAALAGLTLFGAGYFGANSLVTLVFTQTFETSLFEAGLALSSAPIAWALASMLAPRLGAQGAPPVWGMALAAAGVMAVAVLGFGGVSWEAALVAWTLVGLGVGLSYPGLYLRATTEDGSMTATTLAAAAITTESFGGLIGSTAAGGLGSLGGKLDLSRGDAWSWAYVGLALFLAAAAFAGLRSNDVRSPEVTDPEATDERGPRETTKGESHVST